MDKERVRQMLINSYEAGYRDRGFWCRTMPGPIHHDLCREEFESSIDKMLENME